MSTELRQRMIYLAARKIIIHQSCHYPRNVRVVFLVIIVCLKYQSVHCVSFVLSLHLNFLLWGVEVTNEPHSLSEFSFKSTSLFSISSSMSSVSFFAFVTTLCLSPFAFPYKFTVFISNMKEFR